MPHLAEVIKDSHALKLLHLAVQAPERCSRAQLLEGFIHELHLLAGGQEDNDFGLQVGLDEGPQHIHLLLQLAHHICLPQQESNKFATGSERGRM